jgi:hypothetical protein
VGGPFIIMTLVMWLMIEIVVMPNAKMMTNGRKKRNGQRR